MSDPRFLCHLEELTRIILSPEYLQPKVKLAHVTLFYQVYVHCSVFTVQVVGGRVIKSEDMYDYFVKYMEVFSGDSLPQPKELTDFKDEKL